MLEGLANWLFDPVGLTAHGFCLLWEPGLIWTHALSDGVIGVAYFSIPVMLGVVARQRQDLVFRPVFWLFAAFILLCGLGHWLTLATLWVPIYGLEGVVKAATAVVSIGTAFALWRLLPHALALPSSRQLEEANRALQESEARHRISFEHAPVPSYMLDERGVVTAVSRSGLELLGLDAGGMIGHPFTQFALEGTAGALSADLAGLAGGTALRDVERQFQSRSGDRVDALVSARTERQGGTTLVLCSLVDVSARRQAEAALRATEDRLRQSQKMEAVGQLTGGIAHDFNNMLQGIGGGLDMMERRIAEGQPQEAARFVQAARQSVDRAAGLTRRMLAFARRQALQPLAVGPDALVRGMEELIRRTMGPGVRVRLLLQPGIGPVLCDANQLESALLNLAINARDAMPDGGELTIAAHDRLLDASALADQDGVRPGDFVEIAITDTGEGMGADVLGRAFEPFFTTKPIGRGTGLGLSQVHGFVHQSGGCLRLESRVGQGTTVRILLPRHEEAGHGEAGHEEGQSASRDDRAFAALVPAGRPLGTLARGTVLVVEDEEAIRSLIVEALRDTGCTVLEAGDGATGLGILQSGRQVDMLLTDVGLPGLNGRQLADAARERQPGLPILLMTGYAGSALDAMEFAPGIELIGKPFTLDTLMGRIGALLGTVPATSA